MYMLLKTVLFFKKNIMPLAMFPYFRGLLKDAIMAFVVKFAM